MPPSFKAKQRTLLQSLENALWKKQEALDKERSKQKLLLQQVVFYKNEAARTRDAMEKQLRQDKEDIRANPRALRKIKERTNIKLKPLQRELDKFEADYKRACRSAIDAKVSPVLCFASGCLLPTRRF